MGLFDSFHQEKIFPVTMTSGESFTLDGEEYLGKPHCAGREFAPGEKAYVAFTANENPFGGPVGRRMPIIFAGATKRSWMVEGPSPALLVLGEWQQAEANPLLNRGARDNMVPFDWGNVGSQIFDFGRYYDVSGEAVVSGQPSSMSDKFSVEDLVLRPSSVAGMVCLYSQDDSSVLGYLAREYSGGSISNEWLHIMPTPFGSLSSVGGGRKQGYLFYDNIGDTYTAAFRSGLANLAPGNPTPTVTAWEASYGNLSPDSSVSVAWGFALQGAHLDYLSGVSAAGTCAVHCYSRSEGNWGHVAKIDLTTYMATGYVRPCGLWDQFSDPESGIPQCPENTRWPYAWKTAEWLVWLFGRSGGGTITEAKAKLIAIKASTGSVRTIHDLTGPLYKLLPKSEGTLQDEIEASLMAGNTVDPNTWAEVSGGAFQRPEDGQILLRGAQWEDPELGLVSESGGSAQFTIPYADKPPDGYPVSFGINLTLYPEGGAWNSEGGPTIAPDCPRLACGHSDFVSDSDEIDFPRGIVDRVDGRAYVCLRQPAHLSDGTADSTLDSSSYTYAGYEDFTHLAGSTVATFRVYKFARHITSVTFGYPLKFWKPVFKLYGPSGFEDECDLTRTFTDGSGNIAYREPKIYEYGTKGDYLWVLAADWWGAEDSRLTLILINRISMAELDRLDLTPGSGREANLASRPQLLVGQDGDGVFVEVTAIWTSPEALLRQVCRYISSALSITETATLVSPDHPRLDESRTLTLRNGEACWIHDNSKVYKAAV